MKEATNQEHPLVPELQAWREAYNHLRAAYGLVYLSKPVPQDKRDGFLLSLNILSDDCEHLGDLLEKRIKAQQPKATPKEEE